MLGEGFGVGSKPGSGARVGVEGAPVCGLLLGPPAYALAVAAAPTFVGQQNNRPTWCVVNQKSESVDDQASRGHWTDKHRN